MDSKTEDFITKFCINAENLYCKICWRNDENNLFTIQIFSRDQSSSGRFTQDQAKKFGDRHDENDEEYSKNVMDALKGKNNEYIFDITPLERSSNESKFCWKRKIPGGYILHGDVTLRRDDPVGSKDIVLDYLLRKNMELQSTIEDLNNKNETLISDRDKCIKEFENLVDIKNSIETTLYGKFVQLLNAKKKRIKLLEHQLRA